MEEQLPESHVKKRAGERSQKAGIVDLAQIVMGAATLGVPFALTEEAWTLGAELPTMNVLCILASSLVIVSVYAYFYYHHGNEVVAWRSFVFRVFLIYLVAASIAALALLLVQKLPSDDLAISIGRIVVVAFPASFAAAVLDSFD